MSVPRLAWRTPAARGWLALFALLAAVLAPVGADAEFRSPAADVVLLTGRGTATSPYGSVQALAKGYQIFAGDILHTGPNSYMNLHFTDGAFFLMRPNTRFQVNEYSNTNPPAPEPAKPGAAAPPVAPADASQGAGSRAFFTLVKGGFRSISGAIGKVRHEEMQVNTPVATIGIRGTDYLAWLCDSACATDPIIVEALPPGASALGGLVTTVYLDSIVVTSAKGEIVVAENQYVLTLPDGTHIRLSGEPHFLHMDPIPKPSDCV